MFACCCSSGEEAAVEMVGSVSLAAQSEKLGRVSFTSSEDLPCEYEATLKRQTTKENWGMSVEVLPNIGMFVTLLREGGKGAVLLYNKEVSECQRISEHDRIVSVNGAEAATDISQALTSALEVAMVMRRPSIFEHTFVANGKPMGLALINLQSGTGLYVQGVSPDSYVLEQGVDILVGDRILEINGRAATPKDMLKELRAAGPVTLTIARA